jgi:hypothetical protein
LEVRAADGTERVPVADNRETVLPGAAVALIGFWRYGSKKWSLSDCTVGSPSMARTCRRRDTLTAHCLIKQEYSLEERDAVRRKCDFRARSTIAPTGRRNVG